MTLADRLKELMGERGIDNRAELAKGAGLPYTTVVAIFETGGDNTKLSTMKKLANYFGITLDELANGQTKDDIQTIAAHHDGEDWTEEELQDIEEFKELLKLKRQLKKNKE